MSSPIGVIAGRGALPLAVAEAAERSGAGAFVIRLAGFAIPELAAYPGEDVQLGMLGHAVEHLRANQCKSIVFVGKVDRPDLQTLCFDALGADAAPQLLAAAKEGDDALLRALASVFENQGFVIKAPEEIAQALFCPLGQLTTGALSDRLQQDFLRAFHIAGLMGAEDIGQGCVVCDGLVLAVEAQEGTDAMLRRVALLPEAVRGTRDSRRGVLLKRAKPVQDRRMDLPVIGPETVQHAADAGLAGIGLEAGGALIVQREETVKLAKAFGLVIVGLEASGAVA